MRIVVTGGSGFIGTRLVAELVELGHDVVIFDKNPSEIYPARVFHGDVRDAGALTEALSGADVVYHLAAEHADDVRPIDLYNEVNVGGAQNLVTAAEANGISSIIFTSSVAIYGLNVGEPDEDVVPQPFNPYGASKYEAEVALKKWAADDSKRSLTVVRPCVIFGEGNRGNVYNLLRQIHGKRFVMVGSGRNRKSMGYVGNIACFLASRLESPKGIYVYNYADKPDLTTNELVEKAKQSFGVARKSSLRLPYGVGLLAGFSADILARFTGKSLPISVVRVRKFCANTVVDTKRLEGSGFSRPYSLDEGLRRMIAHESWE